MSFAECQSPNGGNVSGQGNLQRVGRGDAGLGQVEYLNYAIASPGGEEGVGRVERYGTHPPQVGGDDRLSCPGRLPFGRGDVGGRRVLSLDEYTTGTDFPLSPFLDIVIAGGFCPR